MILIIICNFKRYRFGILVAYLLVKRESLSSPMAMVNLWLDQEKRKKVLLPFICFLLDRFDGAADGNCGSTWTCLISR